MKRNLISCIILCFLFSNFLVLAEQHSYHTFVGDGYCLSEDGHLFANFSTDGKQLIISGHGRIDPTLWKALSNSEDNFTIWWGDVLSTPETAENFDIVFKADGEGKIKLPQDSNHLFAGFDGQIYFGENQIDSSDVYDMHSMFELAKNFNQPIPLDTRSVKTMAYMFADAHAFNQPLIFNTNQVTDMSNMFWNAKRFNQKLKLNTANVTTMIAMFAGAENFNQPLNFDTSQVTSMERMFLQAKNFNQELNFNTANVRDMSRMFHSAEQFNQKLTFNTSNVLSMKEMFYAATKFNQKLNFDTAKVEDMNAMFAMAFAFNQPIDFNTANVKDMTNMFANATAFKQDLILNGSSLENCQWMLENSHPRSLSIHFDDIHQAQLIEATDIFTAGSSTADAYLEKLEFNHCSNMRLPAYVFKGDYLVTNLTDGSDNGLFNNHSPFTFKDNHHYSLELVGSQTANNQASNSSIFSDVDSSSPYYPAVENLVKKGILNGTGDGKFSPQQTVNRAMLVTVLYRIQGQPAVTEPSAFTDVEAGAWYEKAVAWAKAKQIVKGISATEFAPLRTLSREQIITVLYRYLHSPKIGTKEAKLLQDFHDSSAIGDYAKDAYAWAMQKKLTKGNAQGLLEPKADITRAELAFMLDKILDDAGIE